MTTALLRISVVAAGSRVDLSVPPALPVAEIVPGLAHRLGVVSSDGLRLCTLTGSALDDSAGLAAQDVPDGAVLSLAVPPPAPVVHDDPVEAVLGTAPAGGSVLWLPATGAGLTLVLSAVTVAAAGQARTAAVVGLLLLVGALLLGRPAPAQAVLAATAASAHAAVAAGLLAVHLRPDAGVEWAARGGGALALATLATAALPSHRLWMLPVLVAGATAALVGAVLSVGTLSPSALVCVLLAVVALLSAAVPWLAAGRITRPPGRVDLDALAAQTRLARDLMVGLAVGLGSVQVVLTPVVARQDGAGVALAGAASASVLLRARHHTAPAESLPGLVAGGLGLLAAAGVAVWLHEGWRPVGALLLAGAGGVLLAQARVPRPPLGGPDAQGSGAWARLALRSLETTCLAALPPLLLLATHPTWAPA